MKDLPFSFYEFLAVLMPGFIFSATIFYLVGPIPEVNSDALLSVLYLICLSYVSGQVLAQLSISFIEWPTKKFLGEPVLILLGINKVSRPLRCLFPYYFKQLHEQRQDLYKTLIGTQDKNDLVQLTYQTVVSKARNTAISEKLNHWTRLSAFSRNIVVGALMIAVGCIVSSFFLERTYCWVILSSLGIAFAMFYRYLRFLRVYSEELVQWFCEQNRTI